MSESTEETPTQRAARLRREKRQAKLASEGNDRLNKITSLGGRPASSEIPLATSSATPTPSRPTGAVPQQAPSNQAFVANDPDEVDISTYTSQNASAEAQAQAQQQMLMRQMLRGEASGAQDPFAMPRGPPGAGGADMPPDMANDPMMQMMQSMFGGQMPNPSDPNAAAGLPPALAAMLNGGMNGGPQAQSTPASSADYLWRVVHALFAFLLSLYTVSVFNFTGTKFSREYDLISEDGSSVNSAPKLFVMFATMELVLQAARYLVDGGKLPQTGMMGMIGGLLPEPWAGYLRAWSRYSIIWSSIVSDVMVVVFVLGVSAWLNGEVSA